MVGRVFDIGEVRAGSFEDEVGEAGDIARESERFVGGEPLALSSRFEFHDESDGRGSVVCGGSESVDLRLIVDHDAYAKLLRRLGVHGRDVPHDEEIARVAVVSQVCGFVEGIDAKPRRAALDKSAPCDAHVVPVGVRLDDGSDLSARGESAFERFHIVGKRMRVDEAATAMKTCL